MAGQDETGHDFAFDDMALHDFRHIGFGFDLIPHAFWVDDDARSFGAMVETAGFIGADDVFQVQPFRFLFETGVERFRSELRAAPAWIIGASLVGTDENMTGKGRHE